jgi:hypothetical protein
MGNPADSSLATGKGLPWGPMDTGKPDKPKYQTDFIEGMGDPRLQALDQNIKKVRLRDNALAGGQAQDQYMGGMTKLMSGAGTQSADAGRNMTDIANSTALSAQRVSADFAMKDLEQRMQQAEFMNKAKERANQLMAQQYGQDMGEFNQEQAGRGQFVNGLAGAAGSLAGAALGGPIGSGLAAKLFGGLASDYAGDPVGKGLAAGMFGGAPDLPGLDPDMAFMLEQGMDPNLADFDMGAGDYPSQYWPSPVRR